MAFDINKINEEYFLSTESFKDDISEHVANIEEMKRLYDEMIAENEKIKLSGFKGATMDRSKTYENLIRLRIGISDANTKVSSIRKNAADLFMKKNAGVEEGNNTQQIARELIKQLQVEGEMKAVRSTRANNNVVTDEDRMRHDKHKLKQIISEKMEKGGISLTKNERAMKYAAKDIDYVYDSSIDDFKLYLINEDRILEYDEYPRERIPDFIIVERESDVVKTNDGKVIRIV